MADELKTEKKEVQVVEGAERTRATRVFTPRVDIFSKDEGVVMLVEMPGVDEKGVDINLEKHVLTINGYITPVAPEGYELAYNEYGVGDYERSFTLPDEIDGHNIDATIADGILRLYLPKAPEAQARKITVNAG